jgi:hypothetical protein
MDYNKDMAYDWDKQEWDDDRTYGYFVKYYLQQPQPRSLAAAYRNYLIEVRGATLEEAVSRNPSESWQHWFRAHDKYGNKVHPEAKTWSERALAYDEAIIKDSMIDSETLSERNHLIAKELHDAKSQIAFWEFLFEKHEEFVRAEAATQKAAGKPFDVNKYINKSKDLWKWRDEISDFARRALKLPSQIKEDPLEDVVEKPYELEWKEQEWNANSPDDIGMGSEDVINHVKNSKGKTEEDNSAGSP